MRLLAYLMKSVTVLNLLLAAAVGFGAYRTVMPLRLDVNYTQPAPKVTEPVKEEPAVQPPPPSPLDFAVIAEQNLFHPERKIPVEKPATPPLPKPDFVLYGVLVTDDTMVAYLEDKKAPQSTPGRGKRQVALKKGESLSGFVMKDITPEKVIMVRGEETVSVTLNDSIKSKTREAGGTPPAPQQPAAPHAGTPPHPAASAVQQALTPPPSSGSRPPQDQKPPEQPQTRREKVRDTEAARKTLMDFFKRK